MLEMAETFVHDPAVRRTGVFPRGAQVLAMVGTRRKPVSSRKAKWAPSCAVFFYSGPDMLLPVPDRGFVTFPSPFIGLLATPSQALHQFPDIRYRVPDTKLTANDLPNALQGPEVGHKSCLHGTLAQDPEQTFFLPEPQQGGPAR